MVVGCVWGVDQVVVGGWVMAVTCRELWHGVAAMSRCLKTVGLFCKRVL